MIADADQEWVYIESGDVRGFVRTDYLQQGKEALEYVKELGTEPLYIEELPEARHIFSHIEWRMKAYRIRVSSLEQTHAPEILFADKKESERNYAIPSAFGAYEKYM